MGVLTRIKHVLIGKPIATKHASHERLPKRIALPVFASDALSSVAYATEEIMHVLHPVSAALVGYTLGLSVIIAALVAIVSLSYFQTIQAYPGGGGSYTVSKENLGMKAGMVAGAALLIDYILTVAVSVSAGVLAIVSLAPSASDHIVLLNVGFVALLTFANLRGAKESGAIFAIPTYTFIVLVAITILYGLTRPAPPLAQEIINARKVTDWQGKLTIFLALKAFSSGCTAMTGVEAISNGVQAFREPVAKNAQKTLVIMALILASMFTGLSFLAQKFSALPMESSAPGFKTVLAQIAATVFGNHSFMFQAIQVATAAILVLAANTAYADFPRLASLIAKDDFLPRQFASLGDRLVFKNGIILLAVASITLLVYFQGDTHHLIPLYAIGVFLCFTLSQAGMVIHNRNEHGSFFGMAINAVGATVTGIVTIVIAWTKFHDGGFIVPIAMGIILFAFVRVKRHYKYLANELSITDSDQVPAVRSTTLLLVPRVHRGILQAIGYARSTAKDCRALHVTLDAKGTGDLKREWDKHGGDMPLMILESPYRSLIEPVIQYIDQAIEEDPDLMITVMVPQAVPKRWWHGFLHNNIAVALKLALAGRKNVVVTNIRYFLK